MNKKQCNAGLLDWRGKLVKGTRIMDEYSKNHNGYENNIKLYMFPDGNFHIQIEAVGNANYVEDSLKIAMDKVKEIQNE